LEACYPLNPLPIKIKVETFYVHSSAVFSLLVILIYATLGFVSADDPVWQPSRTMSGFPHRLLYLDQEARHCIRLTPR
jgi:hypothetical protein